MSDIYDSRGKLINPTFVTPDTSQYDGITGYVDANTEPGSPVSGGNGLINSRISSNNFLGNVIVRDETGSEKVRMGRLQSGSWGLTVYDGVLIGGSITIGSGDSVFKADEDGIRLGDAVFADAPFSVDMSGNVKIAANDTISDTAITFTDSNGDEAIFIGFKTV